VGFITPSSFQAVIVAAGHVEKVFTTQSVTLVQLHMKGSGPFI
jgi:hypothetical protein